MLTVLMVVVFFLSFAFFNNLIDWFAKGGHGALGIVVTILAGIFLLSL